MHRSERVRERERMGGWVDGGGGLYDVMRVGIANWAAP
mgnify:CR=1 FL=1